MVGTLPRTVVRFLDDVPNRQEPDPMARLRAADRRRQLLEVAAELFARNGYRGTTTAELAAAAGVTEPILYRHFQNKLDLFVTLVNEVGRNVIEAWEAALADEEDPQERLQILLAANPATHERGRGVYRVIFQAMTDSAADPRIGRAIRRHVAKLHGFLEQELKRLQREGAVRNDEPAEVLAWLLIDVAVGFGVVSPIGLPSRRQGDAAEDLHRLLMDLLPGG